VLTTPHALIGAFILLTTPNFFLGCFLAFLSHFLIDFFIPHWNPHLYTEIKKNKKVSKNSLKIITWDAIIANVLLLIVAFKLSLSWNKVVLLWVGAFWAIFPDLVEAPYYFFNWKNKYLNRYIEFEHKNQSNANLFWGIITQVLVSLAALYSFFNL